ncbi:MAG TPA: DNA glycosylase [Firmicutes bacterium]|nr:DNA glycosylase [Candidatus Fermentithermobacillaceae bacterium]
MGAQRVAEVDVRKQALDEPGVLQVQLPSPVSLQVSLECGQVFRWKRCDFQGCPDIGIAYKGVTGGTGLIMGQSQPLSDLVWVRYDPGAVSPQDVRDTVLRYLSAEDDIPSIESRLAASGEVMREAVTFGRGLRIIKQDPWEALASYVLSINNSITNISRIIGYLSERLGEPCGLGEKSFPGPERIAGADLTCLRECKCGFRAQNLLDAARKVSGGEIDLDAIPTMTVDEARRELMRIRGVGPKVADCVLLFGYHKLEVFPVDVWVARAVSRYFMGGRPVSPEEARAEGLKRFGQLAGYAQEYLFYYLRSQEL